jgi:hypothetical protein
MVELIRNASVSTLAPEFDDFLFAPIGEERNGMLLSVISALARLDLDPWQEAANLAQLPVTTAACRLASLLETLPDKPSAHPDTGAIATRLIARLPRRAGSRVPSGAQPDEALPGFQLPPMLQTPSFRFAAFVLMIVALGGISVAASQRSVARTHHADAPASRTALPPALSPSSSPLGSKAFEQ